MGLFSKEIATMDDLFVHTLRDMYYAENQIVRALPDMIEKATDRRIWARRKTSSATASGARAQSELVARAKKL